MQQDLRKDWPQRHGGTEEDSAPHQLVKSSVSCGYLARVLRKHCAMTQSGQDKSAVTEQTKITEQTEYGPVAAVRLFRYFRLFRNRPPH